MNLFDKHPIVLDKHMAKVIGLNEAIILQQVHYWIEINKKSKRNYHEGRHWTYNTIDEWTEEFPFWSKDTVKRTFKKLRDMGLMVVGNFNNLQLDRTLWYTIDYKKLDELIEEGKSNLSISAKSPKEHMQKAPMQKDNFTPTIPETSTEITSEISNQSINLNNSELEKINSKEKEMDGLMEYDRIIKNCELEGIDENYRTAASHAIRLLLIELSSSTNIRIGNRNIPASMIKRDIDKLNFFVIDHAVTNFKEACENYEIKSPISYLKSCIYNSIYAIDIDVDSKLRGAGLI